MTLQAAIRHLCVGLAVAFTCGYACCASGQTVPPFGLFHGPANAVLGAAVLNSSRDALNAETARLLAAAIGSAPAAPAAPPIPGPPPSLTYEPDTRLSDWTRARMTDQLDPGGDPQVRRQLEQAFADNAVLKNFDRFMSARGYSSRDIADDTAELLLVSWQIATNGTASPSQREGVHKQVRTVFLNTPQLRVLNDADRQLMAEEIAYQVIVTSSARTESLHNGNEAEQRQLQQTAAALLRKHGIELSQVRLTDEGFHR
jgi:hypothetical protein